MTTCNECKQVNRQLIDAMNLMAELAGFLPDGYEVSLHFNSEECWLDLTSPDGTDVEVFTDGGVCHFVEAIDTAIEREADQ